MTDAKHDLLQALEAIDPARLSYEEWVAVGMGLKDAGHSASNWEVWSSRDARRYHTGECTRKWESFRGGSGTPITGGSIVALARDHGWRPIEDEGYELDWNDIIGARDEQVIIADTAWVESEDVVEPEDWDPVKDLTTYLETLFEANENVGYVTTTWEKDGRYLPSKGNWDRTAGELIQELDVVSRRGSGDIGAVLGDYKPEAGAWIRFNPLDGQGCKNDNVTEFRYALVESDDMPIDKQNAMIRQLELPVACLVSSAGKSLHAIVRVDAADYDEYRKRVDYLYAFCKKNGLAIDSQNKNPSRLSRMPGATRGGRKQFLLATNIGKSSWAEWRDWADAEADVLPVDVTSFSDEWDEELAPLTEIIYGMLGTNEKMMLSGPSKAGKSFALLELCAAIAEGAPWMGMRCKQGHVLYINLELKRDSRIRRLKEVYRARGYDKTHISNIHSLDLRGLSAPLEQLAPKIIRQAAKYQCVAIVIDPIYKIMTGDENSAEHVGRFCNHLDSLSRSLGCSIVYCHHYSKGQQGQKASMDRASGSGVFSRDVDSLVAMTELEVTDDTRKAYLNTLTCERIVSFLDRLPVDGWRDSVPQDSQVVATAFRSACTDLLPVEVMNTLIDDLVELERSVADATAWRLESNLREFAPHKPVDIWYRWPVHDVDDSGVLTDAKIKDMIVLPKQGTRSASDGASRASDRKQRELQDAVENSNFGDPPTTAQAMTYLGMDPESRGDKQKFARLIKNSDKYVRMCVDRGANLWTIGPKGGTDVDS